MWRVLHLGIYFCCIVGLLPSVGQVTRTYTSHTEFGACYLPCIQEPTVSGNQKGNKLTKKNMCPEHECKPSVKIKTSRHTECKACCLACIQGPPVPGNWVVRKSILAKIKTWPEQKCKPSVKIKTSSRKENFKNNVLRTRLNLEDTSTMTNRTIKSRFTAFRAISILDSEMGKICVICFAILILFLLILLHIIGQHYQKKDKCRKEDCKKTDDDCHIGTPSTETAIIDRESKLSLLSEVKRETDKQDEPIDITGKNTENYSMLAKFQETFMPDYKNDGNMDTDRISRSFTLGEEHEVYLDTLTESSSFLFADALCQNNKMEASNEGSKLEKNITLGNHENNNSFSLANQTARLNKWEKPNEKITRCQHSCPPYALWLKESDRDMNKDFVMDDKIDLEEKSYRKPVQVEDEADDEEITNHVDGPVIEDVSQMSNSIPACSKGLISILCSVPAATAFENMSHGIPSETTMCFDSGNLKTHCTDHVSGFSHGVPFLTSLNKERHEIEKLWLVASEERQYKNQQHQRKLEPLRLEVFDSRIADYLVTSEVTANLKGFFLSENAGSSIIGGVKKDFPKYNTGKKSVLQDVLFGKSALCSQIPNQLRSVEVYAVKGSKIGVKKEVSAAVEKIPECRDEPISSTIFEAEDNSHEVSETDRHQVTAGDDRKCDNRLKSLREIAATVVYHNSKHMEAKKEIPISGQFVGPCLLSRRESDALEEGDTPLEHHNAAGGCIIIEDLSHVIQKRNFIDIHEYQHSGDKIPEPAKRNSRLDEIKGLGKQDPNLCLPKTDSHDYGFVVGPSFETRVKTVEELPSHPQSNAEHIDTCVLSPEKLVNHAPTDSITKTVHVMSCNLEGIVKVLGSLSTLPVPLSNKRIRKRTSGRSSKRRIERKTVSPSASLVSWSRKRIQKKRRACTKRQRKKKAMRKYGIFEKRDIMMKLSKGNMRHFARGKEKSQLCQTSSEQVQITKRNCAKGMLEILQLFCMSFPKKRHEVVSKPILKEKLSTRGLPGDFFKYSAAFVPKQYRHIFVYPASLNEYFLRLAKGPAFLQGEENKYEAVRLASFRAWPQWAPVAATRLARYGFYYSGNGDEVVCFSCGGHHRQWSHGDNPMDQHRLRFPDCRLVRGSDTENVPLVPGVALRDSSDGSDPFPNLVRSGSPGLLGGDLASQQALQQSLGFPNEDVLVQSLNSVGTSASEISQLRGPANDSFSHYQHLAGTIGGGQDERDNDRNPTQTAGTFTHQLTEMKSEAARLRTFAHWPISAHVRPYDLAKAGFFYTGNADSVQCAFCSGILRNWDPGDRPMQEHRHHFPTCLYALGVDVGNIALEPDQANLPSAIQESLVTSSAAGGTATTLGGNFYRGDDLGILTERPKHERFAVESTRLATFSHWTSHNTQKPEVLAKAGFFYAGFADNVKCFFCDGGLRNWEHGDDPWTEHARWFPRCEFVKQCKGEDFIRDVQAKHPPQYPPNQPRPAIATPLPAQSSAAVARPPGQFPVEPREIKARLDTPTVQAVLEMGCSRAVVRTAIENRLRTVGDDFPNAESLLEAIFEIEESMNREESQSSAGGVPEPAQPPREQQPHRDTRSTNTTTQTKKKTEEKKNKKKKDKKGAGATISPPGDKDEEAKSLMEENLRLKEQRTCKICMDEDVSVVFLPCGHLVACTQCAPALRNCPICRAIIRGTVRTFLS